MTAEKSCWTKRQRALILLAVASWETTGTSKKNSTNSKTNMHVWLERHSVQVFTLHQKKSKTTHTVGSHILKTIESFFLRRKNLQTSTTKSPHRNPPNANARRLHTSRRPEIPQHLVHRGRINSCVARWPIQQRHCERLCRRARADAFPALGEGCSDAALQTSVADRGISPLPRRAQRMLSHRMTWHTQ